MPTDYATTVVWGLIAVIGIATFAIRGSFIALFGRMDEVPAGVERTLRFVPAAVLAALVGPAFVSLDPVTGTLALDKLLAGGFAAVVAWRTQNVLATMGAGMGALWAVRFLL
jgi:branched-subunit amino acid transport protein